MKKKNSGRPCVSIETLSHVHIIYLSFCSVLCLCETFGFFFFFFDFSLKDTRSRARCDVKNHRCRRAEDVNYNKIKYIYVSPGVRVIRLRDTLNFIRIIINYYIYSVVRCTLKRFVFGAGSLLTAAGNAIKIDYGKPYTLLCIMCTTLYFCREAVSIKRDPSSVVQRSFTTGTRSRGRPQEKM